MSRRPAKLCCSFQPYLKYLGDEKGGFYDTLKACRAVCRESNTESNKISLMKMKLVGKDIYFDHKFTDPSLPVMKRVKLKKELLDALQSDDD